LNYDSCCFACEKRRIRTCIWNCKHELPVVDSALGLAIVVAIASAQTLSDGNNGISSIDALNSGYHLAFTIAAIVAAVATIVAYVAIRESNSSGGKKEKEVVVAAPTG
jgi:ABC-type branched-subunit amino acid transport system permease subunit